MLQLRNLRAKTACFKSQIDLASMLKEKGLTTLVDYYYACIAQTFNEDTYLLQHGINADKYKQFLNLDRTNAGRNIPDLYIHGDTLGQPGYYLRKLNVSKNIFDAAMAACLGKLSDCCQSLSGEAGEPCAIHGLTSPEGGFYVLCKGDPNNPNINDELICQSWVWRSKSGALVIDSIETKKIGEKDQTIAKKFYTELTGKLIAEHNISRVCCGQRSGISGVMNITGLASHEIPKDYNAYRDSDHQCLVMDEKRLYLSSPERFFKKCAEKKLIATAPEFIEMVWYALKEKKTDLLNKYAEWFPEESKSVVENCKKYLSLLESFFQQKSISLSLYDIQNLNSYLFNLSIHGGMTLLHMAILTKRLDIINYLADNEVDLNKQDLHGETILMKVVARGADVEVIKTLLANRANPNIPNPEGSTALMLAVERGVSVEVIEALLVNGANPNIPNPEGSTALMVAVEKGARLEVIEALLANGADPNIVDQNQHTPLMRSLYKSEEIAKCIAKYSDLLKTDDRGYNIVYYMCLEASKFVSPTSSYKDHCANLLKRLREFASYIKDHPQFNVAVRDTRSALEKGTIEDVKYNQFLISNLQEFEKLIPKPPISRTSLTKPNGLLVPYNNFFKENVALPESSYKGDPAKPRSSSAHPASRSRTTTDGLKGQRLRSAPPSKRRPGDSSR